MKLTVITAVWKRPEVFKIFAKSIKSLKGADISVCVTGSEGHISRKMVESEGFLYAEVANKPLGKKMNTAALLARSTEPDYCLMMGSDDIINQKLLNRYIKAAEEGYKYICVYDGYFFDTVTKKALYWGGYRERYRKGKPLGPGRMISKDKMDAVSWQPWYDVKYSDLLDTAFDEKMKFKPQETLNFSMIRNGGCLLDIKSSTNMTPFANWDNTNEIDAKQMLADHFPELQKDIYDI